MDGSMDLFIEFLGFLWGYGFILEWKKEMDYINVVNLFVVEESRYLYSIIKYFLKF